MIGEHTTTPRLGFRKCAVAYKEDRTDEKHGKKHNDSHAK